MTRSTVLLATFLLAVAPLVANASLSGLVLDGLDARIHGGGSATTSEGIDFAHTFYSAVCGVGRTNCVPGPTIPLTWQDRDTTIVVTAANSANYGLDAAAWQALDDAIPNPTIDNLYFGLSPNRGGWNDPFYNSASPSHLLAFDLLSFELAFDIDFKYFTLSPTIVGTGYVPEPSGLLLTAIGMVFCHPRRFRRRTFPRQHRGDCRIQSRQQCQ